MLFVVAVAALASATAGCGSRAGDVGSGAGDVESSGHPTEADVRSAINVIFSSPRAGCRQATDAFLADSYGIGGMKGIKRCVSQGSRRPAKPVDYVKTKALTGRVARVVVVAEPAGRINVKLVWVDGGFLLDGIDAVG